MIKKENIIMLFLLSSLFLSAFFIRIYNMRYSKASTSDGLIFCTMASQVQANGLSGYNARSLIDHFKPDYDSIQQSMPGYLTAPLFKHPPVFTFLLVAFSSIFKGSMYAKASVPIFFNVALIFFIYELGTYLYNKKVGFIATLIFWMDPISIISAQKMWMDSTICFFTFFSVLCFIFARKSRRAVWFILSGISAGIVINTKYTGVLLPISFLLYAFMYEKELLKSKSFIGSLLLPFVMLIPWLVWNLNVYGMGSILGHAELKHMLHQIISLKMGLGVVIIFAGWFFYYKCGIEKDRIKQMLDDKFFMMMLGILFLGGIFGQDILRSVRWESYPRTSWAAGFFSDEGPLFYIRQLIEFSLFYIFSFLAFFIRSKDKNIKFIKMFVAIQLIFFIMWKGFQCRYILSVIPFLIILAAAMIENIYGWINRIDQRGIKITMGLLFFFTLGYFILKTNYINFQISFPNDMCYF